MPTNLWQPGQSGNSAGRVRRSRNKLSEAVICALLRDFSQHGQKAIARVRTEHPAAYLKIVALVLPREHKIERTNPLSSLSDEELEAMIEHLQESIAQHVASDQAKLIDGDALETTALPATALPAPDEAFKPRRPNKVMETADTAARAHSVAIERVIKTGTRT